MASPYHHYVIADDWIIPPEYEAYYSEAVERLPCYQPNNRQRIVAETRPTRTEAGLSEGAIVFCCFNGTHKITRFTFDRWLDILMRVPDSVLWLLSGSDALWMGVPVLTLSGRSFASRVCGSLVRSAGLPELVTTQPEDYVDMAVSLGRDPDRLAALRARLSAGRDTCTLFDTPGLVRDLEEIYARMWQACRDDALPVPDLANLDIYLELGASIDHEAQEIQVLADYDGHWQQLLARRHAYRPVPFDRRLWTAPT